MTAPILMRHAIAHRHPHPTGMLRAADRQGAAATAEGGGGS
ncbi:MAG: hypothetical protein U1F00_01575 [Rhodoferax sp.]